MKNRFGLLLTGITLGIGVPGILLSNFRIPVTTVVTGHADDDVESGVIGDCHWQLADHVLTFTGGTLPLTTDYHRPLITAVAEAMGVHWEYLKGQVFKIVIDHVQAPQNCQNLFSEFTAVTTIDGLDTLDTSQVTNMGAMFQDLKWVTTIDCSTFDTRQVTDMGAMFKGDDRLSALNISGFKTGTVTNMVDMFNGDMALKSLDVTGFDTGAVTNMVDMFNGDMALQSLDVSGFNTGVVTDMSGMFFNDRKLETVDVSRFNTSKVTDMSFMFGNMPALQHLDVANFDTSQVTDMRQMFGNDIQSDDDLPANHRLKVLDVSHFKTIQVIDMQKMFAGNTALTNLDVHQFDTRNVIDMNSMFAICPSLKRIDCSGFRTEQVTDMSAMFGTTAEYGTPQLEEVNLAGVNMRITDMDNLSYLFIGQTNLKKITLNADVILSQGSVKTADLPAITGDPAVYTGKWVDQTKLHGPAYSSDELMTLYPQGGGPAGIVTYVWQPVKTTPPVTPPVTPIQPDPEPGPVVPPIPDPGIEEPNFKPFKIYTKQPVYTYSTATFTPKKCLIRYARKARIHAPVFKVVGTANSRNGVPRYRLNNGTYLTANPAYVGRLYWAGNYQRLYVVNPQGINEHNQTKFAGSRVLQHYRQGQVIPVIRRVNRGLTTRYQLANGTYITGNKQWVARTKPHVPRQIIVRRTIRLTRDADGQRFVKKLIRGQRLSIKGWTYTNQYRRNRPSTLRYRVAGGYVTANPRYVTGR